MNPFRAAASRRESWACPGLLPRIEANTDHGRAPITFGWMAYTAAGRISRYFHLESLYRLDRMGDSGKDMVRSRHHGKSVAQLRDMLVARQAALLPKIPADYVWVGPEVIEDIAPGSAEQLRHAANAVPVVRTTRCDPARLAEAQRLASDILRERELAGVSRQKDRREVFGIA